MTSIAFIQKAGGSIVVFVNGKPYTVEPSAINYKPVVKALEEANYDSLVELLNVRKAIADYTNGMVEVYGSDLYFNKKLTKGALAERIVYMLKQGMLIEPYIRFMEKLQKNPLESAREELFLFMESNNLPITPDGDFLTYKYIRSDWKDCYSGTLDNSVGNTVKMPRSDVDPDRNNACSRGLHVCSYEYVAGGGSGGRRLVVCKVNPMNVVAIPNDYNNSKMRVCEYTVVDELTEWADSIQKNYTEDYVRYDDEEWEEEEEAGWDEGEPVYDDGYTVSYHQETENKSASTSSKLTHDDVRSIRKYIAEGWTLAGIAKNFGISARQVARIRDGEAWTDVA